MSANGLGDDNRLRLLVAIASYGEKNAQLLKRVIDQYQAMDLDVDVVVLSNVPRDLGPRVRVVVGLPSANPWSLPFAHKAVFAENVERYDLFAYSEDDIGVTEQNIRAFVRATSQLSPDEIAGFLRYEIAQSGLLSFPDVHGGYRWNPASARRRGDYTVAEFTNEHAAFYLITRAQLKAMIAHDGFVRAPYLGRYDLPCTAATDPYTVYHFRKVICVSALDDFLIHHLSNRYAGQIGISMACVRDQVQALLDVALGVRPASTLFEAETRWTDGQWAKNYYEQPDRDVLKLVPEGTRTVLSIGCGWGVTEAKLIERGISVTALPIDSVIAALAARLGVDVICGSLDECLSRLEDRYFDCVLMTDLLHLMPDPKHAVERCSRFVRVGGAFVVGGPNFGSLRVWAKRAISMGGYEKLKSYQESGINLINPRLFDSFLWPLGFDASSVRWSAQAEGSAANTWLSRLNSDRWLARARRQAATRVPTST